MSKFQEWSPELEAALAEPFPAEWIKQKSAGGAQISFVPWHRYVSRLNLLCGGGWSMGTPVTLHVGEKLVMGLPLTIFGTTRVNFGDEDDSEWEEVENKRTGETEDKKTMFGSPCTNAFAQAFKRTCALFGLGLSMYDKGGSRGVAGGASAPYQKPRESVEQEGARVRGEVAAQRAAQKDFSLDTVAGSPKSRAKGRTWRELLTTDEGRGYVEWALNTITTLAPAARTALTEALATEKASPTDAILLEDQLNRAANIGAIDADHEQRIRDSIDRGDKDELRIAADWLATQIQKKKLGS